ncbi:hypothetical protein GTA08_BOTSDO12700 [Botryosphaeria dothidea]|uniref:Uncharacterized protein n=1 Tax=Botryosphaeria dothidea TaxID=55169 RepID=A0A8H4J363_9PEZI|nr:hypothetical protein GTA08_BOTSDO12700 [Botryosphaeria dothidea]
MPATRFSTSRQSSRASPYATPPPAATATSPHPSPPSYPPSPQTPPPGPDTSPSTNPGRQEHFDLAGRVLSLWVFEQRVLSFQRHSGLLVDCLYDISAEGKKDLRKEAAGRGESSSEAADPFSSEPPNGPDQQLHREQEQHWERQISREVRELRAQLVRQREQQKQDQDEETQRGTTNGPPMPNIQPPPQPAAATGGDDGAAQQRPEAPVENFLMEL